MFGRVQHGKHHAIPLPDLPGGAGHDGAHLLQRVIGLDGAQHLHLWSLSQQAGCAAYVIAVLVAQQQPIGVFVQSVQQWYQHALAGIAAGAVLRPGIKQQAVRAGTHQNGAALPHIGRQQIEMPVGRARRLPQQHGQQSQSGTPAPGPRQAQQQQQAAHQAR